MLHSDEFVDQPPPEVYATLLSRGVYLASIRTMYRVLAASGESAERRAQRGPMKHAKPTLTATAPNQVWTWDITKLRGPLHGVFYCLYVILDLFSRMTVGWLLAERESAELAEHLFAETVARHGVEPRCAHGARRSRLRDEVGGPRATPRLPRCRAQLQPPSRQRRQRLLRVAIQDAQVPTRLPGALHFSRPCASLVSGVLRLV